MAGKDKDLKSAWCEFGCTVWNNLDMTSLQCPSQLPHFPSSHVAQNQIVQMCDELESFHDKIFNWFFKKKKKKFLIYFSSAENIRQVKAPLVRLWRRLFLGQRLWGHRVRVYSVTPEQASTGHRSPPGCQGAGGWSLGRKLPSRPARARSVRRSGWSKGAPSWALGCAPADIGLQDKENDICLASDVLLTSEEKCELRSCLRLRQKSSLELVLSR